MAYGTILGQTPTHDIPVGGIILWSGSQSNIPTKWQLCDGTNGTPDLRGQFVIGAGGSYAVGNSGGEAEHTLAIGEMPRHTHSLTLKVETNSSGTVGDCLDTGRLVFVPQSYITTAAGASQPHNNLPPYYALCYIMKIA